MNPTRLCALLAAVLPIALAPCQGTLNQPPQPLPLFPVQPRPMPATTPQVTTGLLQVRVEVRDGAATTTLTQTLQNHTAQPQESWWVLPLPAGATADRFTMTVGGVAMQGEVLDANAARTVYEEIVRKRRDPGLLEYLGNGCLRARVFPIPAMGSIEVAVRYTQMVTPSDGITSVRFPMRSLWNDGVGPEKVAFVVDVLTTGAIKTAWSPQQELAIARDGDHRLLASVEYARGSVPQSDLQLHFGLADQDFGANVLTYRKGNQPGYFAVWLAPKRDWPKQTMPRCVNLVLDTSGSMAGEKIRQARAAVRTFVQSLAAGDHFNIVPFSTDARPFFAEPVPADRAHLDEALQKVDQLEARGGTNIGEALTFALQHSLPAGAAAGAIVPITIFLTDGLPTVGTTDIDQLLQLQRTGNQGKARVFVFGVGADVNTRLLDTLAAESRGDRDYVQPGEDIEQKTGSLFAKLSGPVLTDLQLTFDGLQTTDLEPRQLPDLFVQGQIAIVGRYQGDGHKAIRLRGNVGGAAKEYVFEATFAADNHQHDWLPTLWAQRRVAALLDAIRMHGQSQELVAEVTRLGKEFGIVTPFTSHLVVEEGLRVASARGVEPGTAMAGFGSFADRLRGEWSRAGLQAPPGDAGLADLPAAAKAEADRSTEALKLEVETGAAAVQQSVALIAMVEDHIARDDGAIGLMHRRIGERTFHLIAGVWVDGAFTADMRASVRKVTAFSDEYFALLREQPDLVGPLAFSTHIVVVTDAGQAIEVGE